MSRMTALIAEARASGPLLIWSLPGIRHSGAMRSIEPGIPIE
jgi:hypothetical protein